MNNIFNTIITEMEREIANTRIFLERIPEDKMAWKPHAKSMSLGQLALHVATLPNTISQFLSTDVLEVGGVNFELKEAANRAELLAALDESVRVSKEVLGKIDDQQAMTPWTLAKNGEELFTVPKATLARSLLLNHWYHHRGQLSVYLRLLDVPVPAIYGKSADENPFGL